MFISVLDIFKIGIGPSSSHTMGPMVAAHKFIQNVSEEIKKGKKQVNNTSIRCTLKNSLAHTGKGHASDSAIILGLNGYLPNKMNDIDIDALVKDLSKKKFIKVEGIELIFNTSKDIIFDLKNSLSQHPNGMIFEWIDDTNNILLTETYFSIGGGFIKSLAEIHKLKAPIDSRYNEPCKYNFDSAESMLKMSKESGLSIAQMKRVSEAQYISNEELNIKLDEIWDSMKLCIERGLKSEGILPGGLNTPRRAKNLFNKLKQSPKEATSSEWLCAYAMAVNEENAAGHMVVTAPTNGAAGIIPAVLYYIVFHQNASKEQVYDFLLTSSAIGGLIKHLSSISGAEVGCQGEVGSASSMAAAGLCAAKGGSSKQIENAAEVALEHHLGLTCDPVKGLVQVPCIERNGFGAIKAYLAASIILKEDGNHLVSLDSCIEAMKKTGLDMSNKYKETSLGGLAVSMTEC